MWFPLILIRDSFSKKVQNNLDKEKKYLINCVFKVSIY